VKIFTNIDEILQSFILAELHHQSLHSKSNEWHHHQIANVTIPFPSSLSASSTSIQQHTSSFMRAHLNIDIFCRGFFFFEKNANEI